jgi:hypothetical protein
MQQPYLPRKCRKNSKGLMKSNSDFVCSLRENRKGSDFRSSSDKENKMRRDWVRSNRTKIKRKD